VKREQDIPVKGCCDRTEELAERAHENGEIFYLTRDGQPLAAVVPVGMKATAIPGALDAAYDAAFPGLPGDMTEGQARRRLAAALNAAYMHYADGLERAEQYGAQRAMSEAWRRFELNEEEPDSPAADALARHIGDHPVTTVMAAMRILGWKLDLEIVVPNDEGSS
jgi:antitoxin (DNA-binding transcriptional repressor) of toxin-antitoxin stability system